MQSGTNKERMRNSFYAGNALFPTNKGDIESSVAVATDLAYSASRGRFLCSSTLSQLGLSYPYLFMDLIY